MRITLARTWLSAILVALFTGTAVPAEPSRLALLPLDPRLRPTIDLLTAELSKDDRIALLERAQIDALLVEQSLSRVNAGDYVKVGQLLGAQGLLILELGKEGDRELLTSRLVAVGPGVVLGLAQAPWPRDPALLAASGRGLELFLEGSRMLLNADAAPDYAWYGLGMEALRVASEALTHYHVSPRDRAQGGEELVQLRALCHEVSSLYDESPVLRDSYLEVQRVRAFSGAYWQEDPAATVELYRKIFLAPACVPVRRELLLWRTERGCLVPLLIAWRPSR